jgi:hypothetical protein
MTGDFFPVSRFAAAVVAALPPQTEVIISQGTPIPNEATEFFFAIFWGLSGELLQDALQILRHTRVECFHRRNEMTLLQPYAWSQFVVVLLQNFSTIVDALQLFSLPLITA